ncbi:MAG: serine/threonine-protein kinase, partial [Nannocystaceae bacterium]|nr:serine/threonine-protein kinase [Nannocystaceae bacterium]
RRRRSGRGRRRFCAAVDPATMRAVSERSGHGRDPAASPSRLELRRRGGTAAQPAALARYIVLARLGRGGDGIVYAAWDPELDRRVAIKLLRRAGGREARLVREARMLAKLSHPNIVKLHDVERDVDADDGVTVFLVMEYLGGGDLARWLAQRRRGVAELVRVFATVGRALAAAHRAGIVHRDVKPSNILLDDHGHPRVVDFGLAEHERTEAAEIVGTLPYMAPEQHRGAAADARADQWSLAVSLLEALRGERVFVGPPSVLAAAKARGAFVLPPGLPRALGRAITRALSPDPAQRFDDMDAFVAAIERAMQRTRWPARAALAAAVAGGVALLRSGLAEPPCALPEGAPSAVAAESALWRDSGAAPTVARLSELTAGWDASWRALCGEASDGTSTAVREASRACLQREAASWSAALATAERAAGPARARAQALLDTWRDQPRCDESDGALPQAIDDASAWVAAAQAGVLHRLGRDADALAIVAGASEGTEVSAAARASLRRVAAAAHAQRGEYERASEALFEAAWQAERAGDDRSAALAWLELAWLEGVERGDARAQQWHGFAAAAVERAGAPARLRAELLHLQGGLHYRAGRLDAALHDYREALALQRIEVGDDDPWVARTHNHLGNVHGERGEHDLAADSCAQALAIRRASLVPDHPLVAAALNNLAQVRLRQHQPAAAAALVEESLQRLTGQGGPHELVARVLQAQVLRELGQTAAATRELRAALGVRIARLERDHPTAVLARDQLAALQARSR